MRANQVEALLVTLADRIARGESVEDQHIELKRAWPTDHHKAARQIAGLCNAALGQVALYVIGIDERAGVVGCDSRDIAEWWPRTRAHFLDDPPTVYDHAFTIHNLPVHVFVFETDRSPYLVRSKTGGQIESEIPWREGTTTKTARRQNLLQILATSISTPDFSLVSADIRLRPVDSPKSQAGRFYRCGIELRIYTIPRNHQTAIVLPYHLLRLELDDPSAVLDLRPGHPYWVLEDMGPDRRQFRPGDEPIFPVDNRLSRTIDSTPSEAFVTGPGLLVCRFGLGEINSPPSPGSRISGVLRLTTVPGYTVSSIPFTTRSMSEEMGLSTS